MIDVPSNKVLSRRFCAEGRMYVIDNRCNWSFWRAGDMGQILD